MKSISIHKLDNKLYQLIKKKAALTGTSMNKIIKTLLRESLGLSDRSRLNHREDFLDIFGIWKQRDEEEFNRTAEDFKAIDSEDWQ